MNYLSVPWVFVIKLLEPSRSQRVQVWRPSVEQYHDTIARLNHRIIDDRRFANISLVANT